MNETTQLKGIVVNVIYQNEETGYSVLRLDVGGDANATVVGCIPYAAPGERLLVTGQWTRHATHGEQFKADYAERELPQGAAAIYDYLCWRTVKGIGPATAKALVKEFGEKTLDVIENEPEKLTRISGINEKRAKQISAHFHRLVGLRRLMEFLARFEIAPRIAMRLYKYYGDDALELVQENPYILAKDYIGAEFSEADAMALALGFDGDSPERVGAAVIFELTHNLGNGHCFIPREKLIAATAQLIGSQSEAVEEGLDVLLDEGDVVRCTVAGQDACYLERLYEAETYVAERLRLMALGRPNDAKGADKLIDRIEREQGITYAPEQRAAVHAAARGQLVVITGGPGTGKTTSIRGIIALMNKLGLEVALTAPTGRAAKRMSELTGQEAVTVHRLLEASFAGEGGETVFGRDESDPLPADAVILDESSMMDIILMRALLGAMRPSARLIMVGDADQLPSIGAGNVFLDIIRSCITDTVYLTEIFRQSGESRIIRNAHMINCGELPPIGENEGDFFFMRRRDASRAADTIVELCSKRLPDKMGFDPMDIQVLCPTRKYETGTLNLNRRLQDALNPPDERKKEHRFGEIVFREGDKVMQIRNNYDIIWKDKSGTTMGAGIFNGDIGRIISIDNAEQLLTVDFDGRRALYTFELLSELEHAWAMTVHKSQGSEFRCVIFSAGKGAPMLMTRSILYTGVTRAREMLIIVGDDEIIKAMTMNHRQTRRYSGLRARLAE